MNACRYGPPGCRREESAKWCSTRLRCWRPAAAPVRRAGQTPGVVARPKRFEPVGASPFAAAASALAPAIGDAGSDAHRQPPGRVLRTGDLTRRPGDPGGPDGPWGPPEASKPLASPLVRQGPAHAHPARRRRDAHNRTRERAATAGAGEAESTHIDGSADGPLDVPEHAAHNLQRAAPTAPSMCR